METQGKPLANHIDMVPIVGSKLSSASCCVNLAQPFHLSVNWFHKMGINYSAYGQDEIPIIALVK